jgi:hypothetical protein
MILGDEVCIANSALLDDSVYKLVRDNGNSLINQVLEANWPDCNTMKPSGQTAALSDDQVSASIVAMSSFGRRREFVREKYLRFRFVTNNSLCARVCPTPVLPSRTIRHGGLLFYRDQSLLRECFCIAGTDYSVRLYTKVEDLLSMQPFLILGLQNSSVSVVDYGTSGSASSSLRKARFDFAFRLSTPNGVFLFEVQDAAELASWVSELQAAQLSLQNTASRRSAPSNNGSLRSDGSGPANLSGYLSKRGKGQLSHVLTRWFVISDSELKYFRERGGALLGSIDLSISTLKPHEGLDEARRYGFDLCTPGRTFTIFTDSPDVQQTWTAALRVAIEHAVLAKAEQVASPETSHGHGHGRPLSESSSSTSSPMLTRARSEVRVRSVFFPAGSVGNAAVAAVAAVPPRKNLAASVSMASSVSLTDDAIGPPLPPREGGGSAKANAMARRQQSQTAKLSLPRKNVAQKEFEGEDVIDRTDVDSGALSPRSLQRLQMGGSPLPSPSPSPLPSLSPSPSPSPSPVIVESKVDAPSTPVRVAPARPPRASAGTPVSESARLVAAASSPVSSEQAPAGGSGRARRGTALTPEMLQEVETARVESFAKEHMKVRRKMRASVMIPIFKRENQTSDELLVYSPGAPQSTLLPYASKSEEKEALLASAMVVRFMGDMDKYAGGRDADALQLASTGVSHLCVRDEVFLTIMKQTTQNPRTGSLRLGWELLAVLLESFPPSSKLEKYVKSYIKDHVSLDEFAGEAADREFQQWIAKMARHCFLRIKVRCMDLQTRVPSTKEIQRIRLYPTQPSMFGRTLQDLVAIQGRQSNPTYKLHPIPFLFTASLCGVVEAGGTMSEGLFRLSTTADKMGDFKADLESWDFQFLGRDPNVIACVVKQWLSSLYDPVITIDFYDRCLAMADLDANEFSAAASAALAEMEAENRIVLCTLVRFIRFMAQPAVCDRTKMTASNLSLIFAALIFRCPSTETLVIISNSPREHRFLLRLVEELDLSDYSGNPCALPPAIASMLEALKISK